MSSTYMSSVFLSGSPRNDAGPLADRTAPTLTWATTDPPVTDTARPISAAAIVIFCIIAEPSLFELAKSAPEGMPNVRRSHHWPSVLSYMPMALFPPCFKSSPVLRIDLHQNTLGAAASPSDPGASDEFAHRDIR